jgi:hypothetical protein
VSLGHVLPRRRGAEHGLLLVEWQSHEDHTERFVGSPEFQQWRAVVGPFPRERPSSGTTPDVWMMARC